MRIVSLLPSATEMVCALGLEDQLVGVTHECDYPPFVRQLPKVTHTLIPTGVPSNEIDRLVREQRRTNQALYTFDRPTLETLQPHLIVTQALCDVCAVAEEEVQTAVCTLPHNPRVLNLEPQTLSQVLAAIRQVARAADVERKADKVVGALQSRFEAVAAQTTQMRHQPRVALLEWLDPPFSCGHWNPELVRVAGGVEGLGREGQLSRTLSWDEIVAWQPEVIFIACCGFSIERTLADIPRLHSVPGWRDIPAVHSGQVYVADGAHYFSRPGPRLIDSLEILAYALDPTAHPLPDGLPPPVRVANSAETHQTSSVLA